MAGAPPKVALTEGFTAAFGVEAAVLLVAALLAAATLGTRLGARAPVTAP